MNWLILSATFNVILVMAVWAGWRSIHKLIKDNVGLDRQNHSLRVRVSQAEMAAKIYQLTQPAPKAQFDNKTTSLLRLAIGNPNANEGRSAAVEACKRIHKKLNG